MGSFTRQTCCFPLLLLGLSSLFDCSTGTATGGDEGSGGQDDGTTPPIPEDPAPIIPPLKRERPSTPREPTDGLTPTLPNSGGDAGNSSGGTTLPAVRPPAPKNAAGAGGAVALGGETEPTDYTSTRGVTGCCVGDKELYFYDSSAGNVTHVTCTTTCGWNAGFYKCDGQGEDSSGKNVRACNVSKPSPVGGGSPVTSFPPTSKPSSTLSCKSDVPTFVGCCVGDSYYLCQDATSSAPATSDCTKKTGKDGQKQKCGWSPATSGTPIGFYGCVDRSARDTDPSCTYARVCKPPVAACPMLSRKSCYQ